MSLPARVKITVTEAAGVARVAFPFSRGIPFPAGQHKDLAAHQVFAPGGKAVPTQSRVLSRWPDGTVKWLLVDFQADVSAGGQSHYELGPGSARPPRHPTPVSVQETQDLISVDTGPLQFSVSKHRFSLIEEASHEGRQIVRPGAGDSTVTIRESRLEPDGKRYLYGLGGGVCRASLATDAYRAVVEEAGPLRAVVRCDGAYDADYPMGNYSPYRPMTFTVRIYAYAGQPWVRVLHTVVFTGNPRETEIEEIAVRLPVILGSGPKRRLVSGDSPAHDIARPVRGGSGLLLSQGTDAQYAVVEREGERSRRVAEGARTRGYALLEGGRAGIAVGLRYMREEYPKAIGLDGSDEGIDIYLWRDPDGKRLSFRRYDEVVHWELGESVYSDGLGVGKTHEYFLHFYDPVAGDPREAVAGLLEPPHVATDPAYNASTGALGGFLPRDRAAFPRTEELFDRYVEWVTWNTESGRWYGCYNFGDHMITFDKETGRWKLVGRWSWNNSEFDPRHGLWVQYLRTGDPELFRIAEYSTRHSVDVDTCHYNQLRPYTVGGCFRHSVDHWGDEPCPSHTFIDNWVDHYYLTGDARTLDVIKEAGEYFLRFRWTEDPRLTFSLRGMANNFRGLCHLHEVTGEARYMEKARELFELFLRGQNPDGSWNKRFQVSTSDRQGLQHPFGMASEGTVLAVEMDHVDQFTQAELVKLFGERARFQKILAPRELVFSGYQMHYLLPAIELYYALTADKRASDAFVRCVDWFCGWDMPEEKRFIAERYCGMLGRSLAVAHEYTGDAKYLHVGKELLEFMLDDDTPHPDARVKGTKHTSSMSVSLLFWGVPRLLAALKGAGLSEAAVRSGGPGDGQPARLH